MTPIQVVAGADTVVAGANNVIAGYGEGGTLTLTPDGHVSATGIENEVGGTTNLHQSVDDSPDASDGDTTFLVNSGSASGHAWFTLSNTPEDFASMTSLSVRVRARAVA